MSNPNSGSPRFIEEAALRAWPAEQQLLCDGWVARLSDGYTKRANSALLLYPQPESASDETLARIERLYQARELPVIFRLLSFTTPVELDSRLEASGYRLADPTLVMSSTIESALEQDGSVRELDLETGIDAHARMNHLPAEILPGHRAILERIPIGLGFYGLYEQDELVACGLSVVDGQLVGLFDIVTDPAHRRKGYAARLTRGMLAHALEQGSTRAYLQVISNNAPAIALYQSLGFSESYRYGYRMLHR